MNPLPPHTIQSVELLSTDEQLCIIKEIGKERIIRRIRIMRRLFPNLSLFIDWVKDDNDVIAFCLEMRLCVAIWIERKYGPSRTLRALAVTPSIEDRIVIRPEDPDVHVRIQAYLHQLDLLIRSA